MNYSIELIQKPVIDILIAVAEKGGVENCINMAGRYLVSKGFRVRVIQIVYEGYSWADEELEFYHLYDSKKDNTVGKFIDGYKKKLEEIGIPNLVLATAWPIMSHVAKSVAALVHADYLVASWLHAPVSRYEMAGYGGIEMLNAADFHLAISNAIAEEIRRGIDDAKIYRIYNPINSSKIKKVTRNANGTLLYVGRISAEKNLQFVFDALSKTKDNWHLRLVGDGDEIDNLGKLAKNLGISDRIEFLGWSDDPWKYADGCSALIMSSFYEGFPLVAIEALSCGIPVIANRASGVDELVDSGVNGYIYDDGDSAGLINLLNVLYTTADDTKISERCILSVAEYSYEAAMFDMYQKVYAAINGRIVTGRLYGCSDKYNIDGKISVIIPCFNAEKYIKRCMDSIIQQSIGIEHLEIIIVNDCSTDNTLEQLLEYENAYPDSVCVVNCEENGGQGKARNIGMNYATGDYITFVDIDDYLNKDMLLMLYTLSVCYPVDMIKCDFMTVTDEGKTGIEERSEKANLVVIDSVADRKEVFIDNAFICAPWAKLIKRSVLEKYNIRFPEGPKMEDLFFTYVLVSKIKSSIQCSYRGYFYYLNSNGTMQSEKLKNYYMDVFYMFKEAIDEYRKMEIFSDLLEEITFVFYKKIFIDLIIYMDNAFTEIPVDNVNELIGYSQKCIGDYKTNKYLSNEDKVFIDELLSD